MEMKVKDRLPGIGVDVEYCSIARSGDSSFCREVARHFEHMRQQLAVIRPDVVESRDVFLGADQDMHRSLRIDVMKRKDAIVFESYL